MVTKTVHPNHGGVQSWEEASMCSATASQLSEGLCVVPMAVESVQCASHLMGPMEPVDSIWQAPRKTVVGVSSWEVFVHAGLAGGSTELRLRMGLSIISMQLCTSTACNLPLAPKTSPIDGREHLICWLGASLLLDLKTSEV